MSSPVRSILLALLASSGTSVAAQTPAPAPALNPSSFLIADQAAEVALARSAAPKAISDSATVLVLNRQGYVQAAPGSNGFVCLVVRAFTGPLTDIPSWRDPKIHVPMCLNPAAVRSVLPETKMRTSLVMSGVSATDIVARTYHAYETHELPLPESGAMAYMMSHHQFLAEDDPTFKSHVMFFYSGGRSGGREWGAGGLDAPIIDAGVDDKTGISVIVIPVRTWSDGTPSVN